MGQHPFLVLGLHDAIATHAAWFTAVLLLSLRLAALFLATPILGAAAIPPTVRVLLMLGLAAALSLGLPGAQLDPATANELVGGSGWLRAGATELALGATLGLGVLLAFAAFSMAGELLGVQMGFGLGQVMDPTSADGAVPLLAGALDQAAVLVFFLVNGHHALLRGIAFSVERFPLGRAWPIDGAIGPILEQAGRLFALGFSLSAPVVVALMVLEVALGVVARNLPQINMISMGIPLKVVAGLVAAALWIGGAGDVMTRIYASIFRTWDAVFPVGAAAPRDARETLGLGPAAVRGEVC